MNDRFKHGIQHSIEVIKTTNGMKATAAQLVDFIERRYAWLILEAYILQDTPTMVLVALVETETTHPKQPERFGVIAGWGGDHILIEEDTYRKLAAAL